MKKKIQKGFTLIEVMIVVAIVAIITAIALPSYTQHVRKAKRTDAKVELLRIAQLQESYFVQNLTYADSLHIEAGGLGLAATGEDIKSEQEEYVITISAGRAVTTTNTAGSCDGTSTSACTSYTLTATPQGGQANDGCNKFTLSNTGAKDVVDELTGYDVQRCW